MNEVFKILGILVIGGLLISVLILEAKEPNPCLQSKSVERVSPSLFKSIKEHGINKDYIIHNTIRNK